MSDLSQLAAEPWFLVLVGFLAGGTLFMWSDYFLRRYRTYKSVEETIPTEEAIDLYSHIQLTKKLLDLDEDGVSHQAFHEAAALSLKLMQLGIHTPFIPELKDRMLYGSFGEDFIRYLAAIEPYIRDGNIKSAKFFAKSALKIVYGDAKSEINQDEADEPPLPPTPEEETRP